MAFMRIVPALLLLLAVFVAATGCNKKSEPITAAYLEGKWDFHSVFEVGEGYTATEKGWILFGEDGTFFGVSEAKAIDPTTNELFFSFSGPDGGTWSIREGRLILVFEYMDIEQFRSEAPDLTKAMFAEAVEEELGTEEGYTVIIRNDDEMELRDEEIDAVSYYTRNKEIH